MRHLTKLTQNGTTTPTAEVIVNDLGCDVTWYYNDLGNYIGQFETPFDPSVKVFCYAPVRDNAGDVTTGTAVDFTMDGNNSSVTLCAYGTPEEGSLQRKDIEGCVFVGFEVI
jgi:hypothetical protein